MNKSGADVAAVMNERVAEAESLQRVVQRL